jgi:hypothetical protein
MKNQGKEDHDFSMRNISDGWHIGEFEAVEEFVNPKNDKKSLIIRIKCTDGDDAGLNAAIFCAWDSDNGDKMMASILLAAGLQEQFNKAFPGADVTYFDKKVIEKVAQKLPGIGCQFLQETNKAGYSNTNRVVSLKTDVSKIGTKKGKAAPEETKSGKTAEAAGQSEDW